MERGTAQELMGFYRNELLDNVMPFWLRHGIDRECGGFLHYLDADGSVLSTDKAMWIQGRFTWLLARLYNEVEARSEWLELAAHGIDFILKHAFDADGRCFYSVTRDGRPLRKRRYIFSEAFVMMALAEYARALGGSDGGPELRGRARDLFKLILDHLDTPGLLEPKVNPDTRPARAHGTPMMLLSLTQVMRDMEENALYDEVAERSVREVLQYFVHDDVEALMETVGPDGKRLDGPAGRMVVPGHAIETAWFMMQEAARTNDEALTAQACRILEWSLELGWDPDFGGLLYYVDIEGKPPEPYEHDMKLWWPHTEAIYATLLAHVLTGDDAHLDWHKRIHDWAYDHFPDEDNGEWFGYLRRDGSLSSPVKGNMWKGPFHLPRMLLYSWKLLAGYLQDAAEAPQ